MKIIVGLGNPGEKYNNTRHNAGFMTLDAIAESQNLSWDENKKFKAQIIKDGGTIYVKPLTFMNNSGEAVSAVMSYYDLLPKKLGILKKKDADLSEVLTVVHDDVDIELGKLKQGSGSGSAGHRGINSIIKHLKTKNFNRIRVGIKSDLKEKMGTEKFVLGRFGKDEMTIVENIVKKIKNQITETRD